MLQKQRKQGVNSADLRPFEKFEKQLADLHSIKTGEFKSAPKRKNKGIPVKDYIKVYKDERVKVTGDDVIKTMANMQQEGT